MLCREVLAFSFEFAPENASSRVAQNAAKAEKRRGVKTREMQLHNAQTMLLDRSIELDRAGQGWKT